MFWPTVLILLAARRAVLPGPLLHTWLPDLCPFLSALSRYYGVSEL